jgi:hypothetical protein
VNLCHFFTFYHPKNQLEKYTPPYGTARGDPILIEGTVHVPVSLLCRHDFLFSFSFGKFCLSVRRASFFFRLARVPNNLVKKWEEKVEEKSKEDGGGKKKWENNKSNTTRYLIRKRRVSEWREDPDPLITDGTSRDSLGNLTHLFFFFFFSFQVFFFLPFFLISLLSRNLYRYQYIYRLHTYNTNVRLLRAGAVLHWFPCK